LRKAFKRFYNFGQAGWNEFDFVNSVVFEKADGSLCFIWWCPSTAQWEIGTRGTPFAEGPNEFHGTYRKFMLNAMNRTEEQFQQDCERFNKWHTYTFEAVGPDNRIVTPYETNHLIELSTTQKKSGIDYPCMDDGKESWFKTEFNWNVRPIKIYKFNTNEDCLRTLSELKGLQEGYVAFDPITNNRVKLKNATYLAAHRLRGNGLTMNSICELIVTNEQDEYLATFKEDAPKFERAMDEFGIMLDHMRMFYNQACIEISKLPNSDVLSYQKEFALLVKDHPQAAAMFKAKKNFSDVVHEFNQFTVSKRVDWLKGRLV
jgi:hypothetical protein